MYTEESMNYNNYEDDYIDNNYNEDKRSSIWTILLRILIIFLCLLLVIWIVSKFVGGKKVKNDGQVLKNNISDIRKASEKFFFIDNNLPKNVNDVVTITLSELNDKGLIAKVNDYKGKACSVNSNDSFSKLTKRDTAYLMTIKLTCNEEIQDDIYYYDLEDGECLSCNGDTYMDGNNIVINNGSNGDNNENNDNTFGNIGSGNNNNIDNDSFGNIGSDNNNNSSTGTNENISDLNINCNEWSKWTDTKLDDKNLLVQTRTLYKGFKTTVDSIVPVYGEWSEYSEKAIVETPGIEVEPKEEVIETWSEEKTTTEKISNTDTIKVLSASTTEGEPVCNTKTETVDGKLTTDEFTKYNSKGAIVEIYDIYYNMDCADNLACNQRVYYVKYKTQSKSCTTKPAVTTYTYQELTRETKYLYRSRTVSMQEVKGETIYTDWVEKLEDGYTKTEEKIQYSYKDSVCKG